jgi:hypothetical protein
MLRLCRKLRKSRRLQRKIKRRNKPMAKVLRLVEDAGYVVDPKRGPIPVTEPGVVPEMAAPVSAKEEVPQEKDEIVIDTIGVVPEEMALDPEAKIISAETPKEKKKKK